MKIKWLNNPLAVALLLVVAIMGLAAHDGTANAQLDTSKIEDVLLDRFTGDGNADFIVRFIAQADLTAAYGMDWEERGNYVYDSLAHTATMSQGDAIALLEAGGFKYQTLIGANDLYVWAGTPAAAKALAALPEVYFIRATRTYSIDPVEYTNPFTSLTWAGDFLANHQLTTVGDSPYAVTDWGILDSKADQAWALGARGAGIKVANIDTGVQWNHPALVGQFACASASDPDCWADPSNICGGSACDNNGHGTHTMGTMVSNDDPSLAYIAGMAPDATWIACKGCESGSCSSYALTTCANWILAPGGDPANRPNVVNNSWGGGGGDAWYQTYVNNWRAAGIFPAFSAGNAGPSCSTIGSPGDYQASFASAAHGSNRTIASFSSRGPSTFGHNPYTKPNISAPGVSICSTVPTNGWNCGYSGTSMASPHTAGAVAQLWSCAPSLVGQVDATFQALQASADAPPAGNCGAPPDGQGNYTYGYGYLDVLALVNQNCGSAEPNISVTPTSLSTTLYPDTSFGAYLTIENSGNAALDWNISDDAAWLSENPTSGTVPAGGSAQTLVTFSSNGLTPGVYQASLLVNSNDPDQPVVTVPVTLTVIPAVPDIFISAPPLEMTLFPEETGDMGLSIQNHGNGDLNWDISDDAAWLSELPDTGTIHPGNSTLVTVTFDSSGLTPGVYPADVVVSSNDPDQPEIILPAVLTIVEPDIEVTAPALEMILWPDQSGSINITIANIGTADLDWSITDGASWLSENPASGLLSPGDSIQVEIIFNATGLPPGIYQTDLVISSNDPDQPSITLPTALTVVEPDIEVSAPPLEMTLLEDQIGLLNFTISNTGTANLEWSVSDSAAWLSELPVSGTIIPGESTEVEVKFDSTGLSRGVYQSELEIISDDPDQPVILLPVTLMVIAPELKIISPALDIALFPDETATITVTFQNIGDADLEWTMTDNVEWLTELPTGGMIIPGGSTDIRISYSSMGLPPAVYNGEIEILTNEPHSPGIIGLATLTVNQLEFDLSVGITASHETVGVGDLITYTLTVTNSGPQDATGVKLTDTLPSLVTFKSASNGCTAVLAVVTCDVGDLAVDGSVSVTIVVTAAEIGEAINATWVTSDNFDPDLMNNSESVSTTIHLMTIQFYIPIVQKH